MDPYADAYVTSRTAVIELTRTVEPQRWDEPSPLTPAWRLRDVLGHLVGAVRDITAGNFPTDDMDAWTAAQVAATADLSLAALVDEWAHSNIEASFNVALAQMLFDQVTHEFDLRYGLGVPGDTRSAGVSLSANWVRRILRGPRPAVLVIDGAAHEWPGTDEGRDHEPIELRATSFEFVRAVSGRRSWHQIAAMEWSGSLDYVRSQLFDFGIFSPQPFDVVERDASSPNS